MDISIKTFKEGAVYISATLVLALIPFFCLPIITYRVDPDSFGAYALLQMLVSFAWCVGGLGHGQFFEKFYFKSEQMKQSMLSSILLVIAINSSLLLVLFLGLNFLLGSLFQLPFLWILAVPLSIIPRACSNLAFIDASMSRRPWLRVSLESISPVVLYSVSLALLFLTSFREDALALGLFSSYAIGGLVGLVVLIRKYEWVVPQRKVIGQAYNIGLQIVPAMIGSVVLDLVDRALLDSMSDRYQLGLYGISYQFALLMTLLCIGVAKTITPYIHQAQFDSDSFGRVFRSRLAGGLLIFIGFGACAAYASGYFIELFFSQEYSGASSIAVILVLSYAINGVYAVLSPLAVKASLFRALSYSTLFAVVVNIVCNIALIPTLGAIGAAIATLISFVFRSGLLLFLVWQKLDSLNAPQESLN